MIRRPFVVLGVALALSCAVLAGTDRTSDKPQTAVPEAAKPSLETKAPTVTSASSETPSVTIPLSQPTPPALTTSQPAPAPIVAPASELKAEPAKQDPAKSEPAKSELAKTDLANPDPAKPEPTKTELAKPETAKMAPAKAEPAKSDPPKEETALVAPPPADAATKAVALAPPPKPKQAKPKPKLIPAEKKTEAVAAESSGKPPAFRCFVRDVMAFYDRTHVRCYNKARGQIVFFAVDTSQPIASTVIAKSLNAMQLGKPVTITFAPGSDLNPSNCDAKNCRRLLDIKS